jgi:hypothetical protein
VTAAVAARPAGDLTPEVLTAAAAAVLRVLVRQGHRVTADPDELTRAWRLLAETLGAFGVVVDPDDEVAPGLFMACLRKSALLRTEPGVVPAQRVPEPRRVCVLLRRNQNAFGRHFTEATVWCADHGLNVKSVTNVTAEAVRLSELGEVDAVVSLVAPSSVDEVVLRRAGVELVVTR